MQNKNKITTRELFTKVAVTELELPHSGVFGISILFRGDSRGCTTLSKKTEEKERTIYRSEIRYLTPTATTQVRYVSTSVDSQKDHNEVRKGLGFICLF